MVTKNIVCSVSSSILEIKMGSLFEKRVEIGVKKDGYGELVNEDKIFVGNSMGEHGRVSSSSDIYTSEEGVNEEQNSYEESCSTNSMAWLVMNDNVLHSSSSSDLEVFEKPQLDYRILEKQGPVLSEIEMMKERFAKLLLGEDMSGCGNGVCTALALSNAITNLCASIFGQIWRLVPLPVEKKSMWRREIEWLISISDHIVELIPSLQTFPDGSKIEVMTSRPRSDLYINLPALRKLDNMLLEILDSFEKTEFWYADQGVSSPDSCSRKPIQNQEDKWWLPVPQVPDCGISDDARKHLQYCRDCTNQILKAAMAINGNTLDEMKVPTSYLEALPKNARASLGDLIHRYINSDQFSPEYLLECLDVSSEIQTLDIANRVEAAIYIWRHRTNSKPPNSTNKPKSKSSWEMVKDLVKDADKSEHLVHRAKSLLLCLKQRFPDLRQTTLDMNKIQYNKDVGKSILESYSRVLESLAFNIVARIDDLFYVDDLARQSKQRISVSVAGIIASNCDGIPLSLPAERTPYKTALSSPTSSPVKKLSSPLLGFGVKKLLTAYMMNTPKVKSSGNETRSLELLSSDDTLASETTRSSNYSTNSSESFMSKTSYKEENKG